MALFLEKLALDLVKEQFGPIVNDVARILLKNGKLTLATIARLSEKKIKDIQPCIYILIKQNLVFYQEELEVKLNKTVTYYQISLDAIIRRLMFPKILIVSEGLFGQTGFLIMRSILKHGKILESEILTEIQDDPQVEEEDFRTVFEKMILNRYIIEAIPDLKEIVNTENEPKKKTKRQKLDDEPKENQTQYSSIGIYTPNSYWKVNYDQFLIQFRKEAAIELVIERINPTAGILLKEIFEMVDIPPPSIRLTSSVFTAIQLDAFIHKNPDLERIKAADYLDLFCCESTLVLKKVDEIGGGSYVFPTQKVADNLKLSVIESVIMEKYGQIAKRLFKILLTKKMLDQKQLAQIAMVPIDSARETLYKLLKDGFVSLQEIPKTTDRAVSRTIYLWFVNYNQVLQNVLNYCYKELGNVQQRRVHEFDMSSKLIEKVTALSNGEAIELAHHEEIQLITLKKVSGRLENSEHHLQSYIFILKYF